MYGNNFGAGNNLSERITDDWINRNVPGGVNSPLGEQLDNMMGGNPNPTLGQVYGGAPGVGGLPQFNNMGGQFPGQFNNMGGSYPGRFY